MTPGKIPAKTDHSKECNKESNGDNSTGQTIINETISNLSPLSWQKCAMEIGRTFGVPTLLLLLISYWLLWQVTPPVINMLQEFMTSTIQTQTELAKTQAEIAESQSQLVILVKEVSLAAKEIVSAEQATQKFMSVVEQTHVKQMSILEENNSLLQENNTKLNTIEKAVVKPSTEGGL